MRLEPPPNLPSVNLERELLSRGWTGRFTRCTGEACLTPTEIRLPVHYGLANVSSVSTGLICTSSVRSVRVRCPFKKLSDINAIHMPWTWR
jgi:hypothetical protein